MKISCHIWTTSGSNNQKLSKVFKDILFVSMLANCEVFRVCGYRYLEEAPGPPSSMLKLADDLIHDELFQFFF